MEAPLLLSFLFLFLLPLLFSFFFFIFTKTPTSSSTPSIKLPRSYPLVGSFFAVFVNRHRRLEWLSDILQVSPNATFTLHRLFGQAQVFTANPAVVQHILKTQFHIYQKGDPFRSALSDFLGDGIFNADGESWKFQRQVSSHEFSTKSLRKFVETVVDAELSDRLVPVLNTAATACSVLDFQDVLQRFAFDNVCKIAFGYDPSYLSPSFGQSKFAKAFEDAVRISSLRFQSLVPIFWKLKKFLDIGSEKRLRIAVAEVRGYAKNIIEEKKNELQTNSSIASVDLLSRFLSSGHSDEDFVTDIIISFILAGQDTTSAALTWFFWLLPKYPQVEDRILDEICNKSEDFGYDEVKNLTYTHAALCESMRLYPPVPVDGKQAVADDVLPDGTAAEVLGFIGFLYANWLQIRGNYLSPSLQCLINLCIVLFLIQSVDRLLLMLGCFWIKFRRLKPIAAFGYSSTGENAASPEDYPMVLVQIPMCNEREVYQQSIAAVCIQDWPKDKMLIQVLDDSDELDVQQLIKAEVQKWQQRGVRILYRHRLIRTGYKAGNLKSAMGCDYVKDYEFVAIFDADFQPGPDFLKKTIPHFKGNDELALVQTRWSFVNKDENLLTRLQNINLSFHFEVEQQVNGMFINFFGFNGTAGVWRIKALEECGGWLERTTVEDMDIAVRAHLCGWKFIYLNDVKCLCELPESYEAYKKQQHRWHSGPMQLFRLCFFDVLKSKVSWKKKANLIFLFFLLRKLILPFYSFTLFCIILPLSMFLPEAHLPAWVVCYVPGIMSILNILPAPRSFPFLVPYLLFENTMSVTKFNAMISGLFRFGSSYEWIVTKKLGRSSENNLVALEKELEPLVEGTSLHRSSSESGLQELTKLEISKKVGKNKRNRLYRKELALAVILLTASVRSLLSAQGIHFYFLLFQGISFLVVGLDLIGEQVS